MNNTNSINTGLISIPPFAKAPPGGCRQQAEGAGVHVGETRTPLIFTPAPAAWPKEWTFGTNTEKHLGNTPMLFFILASVRLLLGTSEGVR